MNQYYRMNADSANIRTGPGAGYMDIGDLFRNDVVEVAEKAGSWSRIVNAQHSDGTPVLLAGNRGPLVDYAGDCWATNAYFVAAEALPNPPPLPPNPNPEPVPTTHVLEVMIDGVLKYREEFQ